MFFNKVEKIVEEYERTYKLEVPEELQKLKEIKLEELAIAFDLLKGWKKSDLIPWRSKYCIDTYVKAKPAITGSLRRMLDRVAYMKIDQSDYYATVSYVHGLRECTKESLWKRKPV